MDLGEIGWGDVDWIGVAQDGDKWMAPVNTVMNLWVLPRFCSQQISSATSDVSTATQCISRVAQLRKAYGTRV
jgi:hypothetical protein